MGNQDANSGKSKNRENALNEPDIENQLKNKYSGHFDCIKLLESTKLDYEKREAEITNLLDATHSILETNDFNVTAKLIFDACAKSIGAKSGYVALLSEDGAENELLFLEDGGVPCTVHPDLPMPIRGLRAEAYRTGKVIYDNDFMKSKHIKYMPEGHMALPNVLLTRLT